LAEHPNDIEDLLPVNQHGAARWRRLRTAGAGLVIVALVGPVPVLGQTPEVRRQLDSFRDSVEAVTDPFELRRMEADLLAAARRRRDDAALHIRLGYVALQQGDLGASAHYDAAASEFKWATQLASQWPYGWFALGRAEYALGARAGGDRNNRPVLARDAWQRATHAFTRAATLEPAFAPQLEDLVRRAFRDRMPEKAVVVREALVGAVAETKGSRSARLLLALGRVQREMGDAGALASFESYLAWGENRGVALLELGRTRLGRGDLSGASSYFDGVATDDPLAVAEARADLQPIASEVNLADFDLRRGPARAEMLRRFWIRRDRVELRADGERLAEHLRRLSVARREFLLAGPGGSERLDDRGRIFVRHGEPDDRASFALPGVEPNESWRYRRGGPDLVLHFAARQGPNDFRLVESVLDVSDVRAGPIRSGTAPTAAQQSNGDQLWRSRSALAPLYGQAAGGRPEQLSEFRVQERALGRRSIQVGTQTDSYALRFVQDLDAWGDVLLAGGSGSQPEIQVLFAIPGYAIEPASGAIGVVYPVRVGFVALDSTGSIVAAVDSITRIEPGDRIAANRSLVGRIGVPVRPGRLTVQGAVQYGDRAGTAFGVDSVEVPSPGSGLLALGDVLVGSRRQRLTVPFGDGSDFPVSPGGIVHRSEGLELAVELFGLEADQSAKIKVLIAPDDGPGSELSSVPGWRPFPDRRAEGEVRRNPGGGSIASWRVALPLAKLNGGSWLLAVVATDFSGREARQEARLTVVVP
jgi:GWxTD domain-containing protein